MLRQETSGELRHNVAKDAPRTLHGFLNGSLRSMRGPTTIANQLFEEGWKLLCLLKTYVPAISHFYYCSRPCHIHSLKSNQTGADLRVTF